MRRHHLPSLLVLLALAAGCGTDDGPVKPKPSTGESSSASPSASTDPEAGGPVAGSGAALSPDKAEEWCAALKPAQLSAVTGVEVVEVVAFGKGVSTCSADVPGVELEFFWGSEPTKKSQEQYAESWTRPAGVYDSSDVTLPGGQPAVVATQSGVRTAAAGFVVDGRLVQAQVVAVGADESTTAEDLAEVVQAIVAVYAA